MPAGSALGSRVNSRVAGRFSVQLAKVAAASLLLILMSIVCPADQAEAWGRRKPAGTPNIYVNYDKFKDRTFVGAKVGGNKSSTSYYFSIPGRECSRLPGSYYLQLVSTTNGWRYLDDHDLYYLIDDGKQRYRFDGEWLDRSEVLSGGMVREDRTAQLPISLLRDISSASRVEVRYGIDSGAVGKENMLAQRSLLAKIEEMCGGGEPEEVAL